MGIRSIAIFYGHVASNIGDVAINRGQVEVLLQSFPGAHLQIIFWNASRSEHLDLARGSLAGFEGCATPYFFKSHSSKALAYVADPSRLFADCGIEPPDLVVLSAGEHLFSYRSNENVANLFWRLLPAYAAKAAERPAVMMPSTLGPFERSDARELIASALDMLDFSAVRDLRSRRYMASVGHGSLPVYLDPAFFLSESVSDAVVDAPAGVLGIAMRSGTSGIRVGKPAASTVEASRGDLLSSEAGRFSMRLIELWLGRDERNATVLFVQTAADLPLAEALLACFDARVSVRVPESIDEYLELLRGVCALVTSRFHGAIIAFLANRPAIGTYFGSHGEKMPGLFEALGRSDLAHEITGANVDGLAIRVIEQLPNAEGALSAIVDAIHEGRTRFIGAVKDVGSSDSALGVKSLRRAQAAFGTIAASVAMNGLSAASKKEIRKAKQIYVRRLAALEKSVSELTLEKEMLVTRCAEGARQIKSLESQVLESRNLLDSQAARFVTTLEEINSSARRTAEMNVRAADQVGRNEVEQERRRDELLAVLKESAELVMRGVQDSSAAVERLRAELEGYSTEIKASERERARLESVVVAKDGEIGALRSEKLAAEESWRATIRKCERLEEIAGAHKMRFEGATAKMKEMLRDAEKERSRLAAELDMVRLKQAEVQSELEKIRTEFATAKKQWGDAATGYEANLNRLQASSVRRIAAAEQQIYRTLPYRAGSVLLDRLKRPILWVTLPFALHAEWRTFRAERGSAVEDTSLSETAGVVESGAAARASRPCRIAAPDLTLDLVVSDPAYALDAVGAKGLARLVEQSARLNGKDGRATAFEIVQLARDIGRSLGSGVERDVAVEALAYDRSFGIVRGVFWAAQRANDLALAYDLIREAIAASEAGLSKKQGDLLEQMKRSPAYQLSTLALLGSVAALPIKPVRKRICYILHNSLPFSSGGYATRTHGVATGLREQGYDVYCVTRPGYPGDVNAELEQPTDGDTQVIDGVHYVRLGGAGAKGVPVPQYIEQSANALERLFREIRPEIVMAASNYRVGIMAAAAARRVGVPFVYEVRGWWEVTRASRDPDFVGTASFRIQQMMETATSKHADHVFTLTEPMRERLIEEGVAPSNITLLPNSCNPEKFQPQARDTDLARALGIPDAIPVIGYVGTFVDYEGLDDLARACAELKQDGYEFRLLLVGNENTTGDDRGPISEEIARIAGDAGFEEWLLMPGRVPHEDVSRYYSLIDIAPFPRKPWPVCEMVSPMKPLEAMAMQKAVVASDVRALSEMVRDGSTGRLFRKGDVGSLAQTLKDLLEDQAQREELGRNGSTWVCAHRTWSIVGERGNATLSAVLAGHVQSNG